ncbi:MAG: hypothetical protein HYY16_06475 [Planctomycetes bacterium]|nr:hypothetical protein [Planctomycetota bacterium]
MLTITALAMLWVAQDKDTAEEFYKFPVGTTWRFAQTSGEAEKKIVLKVIKQEAEKVHLESTETGGDEAPEVDFLEWYVKDGMLSMAQEKDGEPVEPFNLLKIGSKKGDKWRASADMPETFEATHMGTLELKVPAGTYKDAVHVQIDLGEGKLSFYLVPRVGLVKMEMLGGGLEEKMELAEFTPGK